MSSSTAIVCLAKCPDHCPVVFKEKATHGWRWPLPPSGLVGLSWFPATALLLWVFVGGHKVESRLWAPCGCSLLGLWPRTLKSLGEVVKRGPGVLEVVSGPLRGSQVAKRAPADQDIELLPPRLGEEEAVSEWTRSWLTSLESITSLIRPRHPGSKEAIKHFKTFVYFKSLWQPNGLLVRM